MKIINRKDIINFKDIVQANAIALELCAFMVPDFKGICDRIWYGMRFILYVVGIYGTQLFSEIINFLYLQGSIIEIASASFLFLTHLVQVLKVIYLYKHSSRIKLLIKSINRPAFQPKSEKQKNILEGYIRKSKIVSYGFWGACVCTCTFWATYPFTEEELRLPLAGWFPFCVTTSPNFELAFIYQFIASTLNGLSNISIDTMMSGLIMVVCAQLSILNDSFMNIRHFAELEVGHEFRDDNGRNEISPRLQDTMNRKLAECVVHHKCILEFKDEFQALFSNSILGQFIVSVIIICITMFEMTLIPIGSLQFFSMVLYQYCMLLEIFLWCYYGNEVIMKSRKLTESAYKSDWVSCGEEYKKKIIFIILRTQKEINIQAGMIFTLSLSTFVKILKSSWSYFAVLLNWWREWSKGIRPRRSNICSSIDNYSRTPTNRIQKLLCFFFGGIVIAELANLYLSIGDLHEMMKALFLTLTNLVSIGKFYVICKNQKHLLCLADKINREEFQPKSLKQAKCLKKYISLSKIISFSLYTGCTLTCGFWSIYPYTEEDGPFLPIAAYVPFNTSNSRVFGLVYAYEIIATLIGGYTDLSVDALMASLIIVICAQLHILNDSLINLNQMARKELERKRSTWIISSKREDIINQKLIECIEHHRAIIDFADNVTGLFTMCMFWQFVVSGFVFCATFFEMTMTNTGLKQRDPLSTKLLSIVLEWIVREIGLNRAWTLKTKTTQFLAYAFDVLNLSISENDLKSICRALIESAKTVKLRFKEDKSKFMVLTTPQKKRGMIILPTQLNDEKAMNLKKFKVPVISVRFFSMVLYQYCMLLEIFPICYFGNEVIVESDRLTNSAYHSDWTNYSFQVRKNLIFFMTRSQRLLKLYAGGFFTMSLDTFIKILKSSWSFVAVLIQIQNKNENID
ncbi:uncharacterized protein LOC130450387 [Diorhabda sublineata]|uniref:uncharacterized protein LOC130450387 n=1 Tax=Diorhabda sublineata TaxID=1163346 RepID=UPI0024E05539|nr:uncharacterized protein LOC130450387 [Diorhabda sublineata]